MRLAIIIPTVAGRELYLDRCIQSFKDTATAPQSIKVIRGHPACGEAWNDGWRRFARDTTFHYLPKPTHYLFAADDLLATDGWFDAALATLSNLTIPAAVTLGEDGESQNLDGPAGAEVPFSRVPLLSHAQAERIFPVPPLHYYSDVWIGDKARSLGYRFVMQYGFRFVHLWAHAGRHADDIEDEALYKREVEKLYL